MKLPAPLFKGRLVQRYKRFFADVTLDNGENITAHCPNPGSMMGLKEPGLVVWVSKSDNPKRKLAYTLELIEIDRTLIGINTNNPNKIAGEALSQQLIPQLSGYTDLRREVKYGERSRVDFLLEAPDRPPCFVEVKNSHLMRTSGLAEFPDSVTSRGAKHLKDLMREVENGHRAIMLFIIQRPDCTTFATAGDIDLNYHESLLEAAASGVEVLCYDCKLSLKEITLNRQLEWRSSAP